MRGYGEAMGSYAKTMAKLWGVMGLLSGGWGELCDIHGKAMGSYVPTMESYAEAMAKPWEVLG